jgi:ribose transport system substrate-binding protein
LDEGAKKYDLAAAGLTIAWQSNDGTAGGQIEKLRQFGNEADVAAIAISVIQADNAAIVSELKKLQAKGVKVITVDGDVNTKTFPDARPYYIGTNNKIAGNALGQCTKTLLEARKVTKGGYVQFAGYVDNDNARNRMDGVKEILSPTYTEIDRMPDETDRTKARENVRNAITNHSDELVALLGIWSYNGPAIAEVVAQKGNHDKVVVATFDAEDKAIEQMAKGNIDVMIVQDPYGMGVQAARLLKAMVTKDDATIKEMFPKPGQQTFATGLRVVAPDKDTPLKAEQFDPKTVEFMPLSKFQEWLKKYNLTSS